MPLYADAATMVVIDGAIVRVRWGLLAWGRRLTAAVAAAVAFAVVYVVAGSWLPGVLGWAATLTSWQVSSDLLDQVRQLGATGLGLAVAGMTARVVWRAMRWQGSADAEVEIVREVRLLGEKVLGRVLDSSVRVQAVVPLPLRVRFTSGVGAGRGAVMQEPEVGWDASLLLEGDVGIAAQRLRGLPLRQLVVIGQPGAGKSVLALLLTQQLLETWDADEPVPVLLAVSSWNPLAESVEHLVVRRLREDFGVSPRVAVELMRRARPGAGQCPWWVMPVLDGLDEIPPAWHEVALRRVEQFTAADRPVVVTCRLREWQRAEALAGALSRATVVRLEPLRPEDVITFLAEPHHGQVLWEPVFEQLRQRPPSVLALALSTPLMVGLARDVYAQHGDPGELTRLSTRQEVIGRLVDGYVDVVYRERTGWERGHTTGRSAFRAGAPARWLSNLAYLSREDGTRDLRWWRLPWEALLTHPTRARRWAALVLTMGTAGPVGLGVWWGRGWLAGLIAGGCWALLMIGCREGWWLPLFEHEFHPPHPPWMSRLSAGQVRDVRVGAIVPAAARTLWGLLGGLPVGVVLGAPVAGAVAGIVTTLVAAAVPGTRRRLAMGGPVSTLRAVHTRALIAGARYGGTAAAAFAVTGWLNSASAMWWGIAGLAGFAAGAAMAGGEEMWLRFRLLQLAVALRYWGDRSLLPVRTIWFLNDGLTPERAVMRLNGTAWQFRHAIIQDHLLTYSRTAVMRRRADAADPHAARQLAELLQEQGNLDEAVAVWRRLAGTGDRYAARQLAELLREQGNLDEAVAVWRRFAGTGDRYAAWQLAGLLREQGDADELRRRADDGDRDAAGQLARLLREQGNADELRRRADDADRDSAFHLARLLRERGDVDELRRSADGGDKNAARQLARLLREQGRLDEAVDLWRLLTKTRDWRAVKELAGLLRLRGDFDGLAQLADAGHDYAKLLLAGLLRVRGDIDGLRRRAKAADQYAAEQLAGLLRERGDVDGLRHRAKAADPHAARELAGLLRVSGDVDGLRHRARTGDRHAAFHLAGLLREQGDIDGLRRRMQAGDRHAAFHLAGLLREQGDIDGLRRRAEAADPHAARQLAELLQEQGNLDEAVAVWRRLADTGDRYAARQLAELLQERGNLDEAVAVWRRLADMGNPHAASHLAGLLREQGNLEELRRRADAGDCGAAGQLTGLLREQGNVDGLRSRARTGDRDAARQLATLLGQQGRIEELHSQADAGDEYAAVQLTRWLREQGNIDELRRRAETGDWNAAYQLARWLREQGNIDELRRRAHMGDRHAAFQLTGWLREQGNLDEAVTVWRHLADTGDWRAVRELAGLLLEQGNLDEAVAVLRRSADTGNRYAAKRLAVLLQAQGNLDEAVAVWRRLADTGDHAVASQLAGLLREQGNLDEAVAVWRRLADTGNRRAAREMAGLLREQGNLDEAVAVLRRLADTGNRYAAKQLAEFLHPTMPHSTGATGQSRPLGRHHLGSG